MEVRMSTSANGTKLSSVLATLGWLAKPCKVSPATAAASMIPRNLVAPAGDAPLDGVVDELLAHEQGAAARREQPLAHQLRDGARNGLTAGPDLIGELLLRGTISNQEPFRSRRSVLAADRDQTRDDPLLDTGQRQPGGQLLRAFETLDQPASQSLASGVSGARAPSAIRSPARNISTEISRPFTARQTARIFPRTTRIAASSRPPCATMVAPRLSGRNVASRASAFNASAGAA